MKKTFKEKLLTILVLSFVFGLFINPLTAKVLRVGVYNKSGMPQWVLWTFFSLMGFITFICLGLIFLKGQINEKTRVLEMEIQDRKQIEDALKASEEKFRGIFENAVEGIFQTDAEGKLISANPALARIYGADSLDHLLSVTGNDVGSLYVFPEKRKEFMETIINKGSISNFEVQFYRIDKSIIWVALSARAVFSEDGTLKYVEGFLTDINKGKSVEQQLKAHKETLEEEVMKRTAEITESNKKMFITLGKLATYSEQISLLNEMGDLLQACNSEQEMYSVVGKYCQRIFAEDTGYLCILNKSKKVLEVVANWGGIEPASMEFDKNRCWSIRMGKLHLVDTPDEQLVCDHITISPDYGYFCAPMSAQGEVLGMVHVMLGKRNKSLSKDEQNEIIEAKKMMLLNIVNRVAPALTNTRLRESLKRQSMRDPLTGLYNRRHMQDALDRELPRAVRKNYSVGFMMLDIDFFKEFNDNYGHEVGDNVLREFGNYLKDSVRSEDVVCRYGGEEFVVILPEIDLENLHKHAERIRKGVMEKVVVKVKEKSLSIEVSIGISIYPDHGDCINDLINSADVALYKAKASGRNRVAVAPY